MKSLVIALLLPTLAAGVGPAIGGHVVSQRDKSFSKSAISVQLGDSVTFRNDDDVVHSVYSATEGYHFNLRAQPPGASAPVRFDREGRVDVRCAFHPGMKLVVTVQR